ncbi:trypsin-like serine peptidase [Leptothermofonsia sp. ETS-13]|uniref:trypsin-like serine peptidase n=1 Tax=Leptothermofonsia sp. ETS-13 TaxID=3035696 RepID=UPI003B9FA58D
MKSIRRNFQVLGTGILSTLFFGSLVAVNDQLDSMATEHSEKRVVSQVRRVNDPAEFRFNTGSKPFFPRSLGVSDNPFPFRTIIGQDDRVPMVSRKFPWSAIGRIEGVAAEGKRYSCTGTLIAKNIVLTNAHCVVNPNTHRVSRSLKFKPNLINGVLQDEADVGIVQAYYYATDFKGEADVVDVNDWAVLKLDKPLGQKYGFLGWKTAPSTEFMKVSKKLALVGYSADFPKAPKSYSGLELTAGPGLTAGVHQGCSIIGEKGGLLLHDCDSKGGASGGPILTKIDGDYYVIALHAGWRKVDGKITNYAVKMSQIEDWLNRSAQKNQ